MVRGRVDRVVTSPARARDPEEIRCVKCDGVMQDTDFVRDDGVGECCIGHRIGKPPHDPDELPMVWWVILGIAVAVCGLVMEAFNLW